MSSRAPGRPRGIERYRQSLDLRTGVITTEARWNSPAGRMTDVRYEVFTDRSRPHVAVVSVTVTPLWEGESSSPTRWTSGPDRASGPWSGVRPGGIWTLVEAEGSGITAALVSVLRGPESGVGSAHEEPLPRRTEERRRRSASALPPDAP